MNEFLFLTLSTTCILNTVIQHYSFTIMMILFPAFRKFHFYTTKIMESVCVCMYVCVCVCPAMRFVMLWGIELKVGMGVGDGPTRFVGIFSKRPHPGSKVIQRSIYLRNALWLPNLVKRTPGQSVVYCWGQRSCRGHQGSTKGQIA